MERQFGDGGFADRSSDAGFGRGGWGGIRNADAFSLMAPPISSGSGVSGSQHARDRTTS